MADGRATTSEQPAVELVNVRKTYGAGGAEVEALREVSVSFGRGRFTAVMGPSGAGKTTLLQIAAGLEPASAGSVKIGDTELVGASIRRLDQVRRQRVGFVFQSYNLLPMLTIFENVVLPLRLRRQRVRRAEARAVLDSVGLAKLGSRLPSQLSGGQQQRAAIARSLLARPEVIFADEPTGALDQATGRQVLALLRQAVDRDGCTMIMVTHDPRVAAWADRVVFIVDGRLHSEITDPTVENVTAELARWEA
ncbi:MAG TPA: ABC transporter ATP-binding protein [Pseudonocardiaceae bacterium]